MKTAQLKKVGLALTSALMVFSSALSNMSIANAKETKYLVREYETGYKTDKGTDLIKLRIKGDDIPDYGSHWGQVAFCVQHGESLPKGSHIYNSGDPTGIYKNAARIAYLATYRYNNGESGGMKRYAFTQNLIWQVIGQASNDYEIGEGYAKWKANILKEYDKWDTMPSFHTSTQTFELGQSKTLQDKNQVLRYYDSFNYTKDGVTFEHTKGSNSMKVTVSDNCSKESVSIINTDAIKGGMSKYANTNSNHVNFVLKSSDKQDLICTPGYSDPKFLNIKIKINAYGNVEIAKKDNKGNYVPNTKFKVSYNKDMSKPIGTYTTGSNGKVTVSKLKPGIIYIQETEVPEHLILDKTIHSVTVKSDQTITYTATNDWKQAYIQVTKKDLKTKQVVKKAGTVFEVLFGDKVVETITTGTNGIAKTGLLDYGTYIIREKKEPANYTIATLTEKQSIKENDFVYSIDIFNEPVLGEINLSKVDKETGKKAQGDATLIGAQYVLKAKNNVLNPADDSILYKAGEVISTKTVGSGIYGDKGQKTVDKNYNIVWSNLPLGDYVVEEMKSPEGYLLDPEAHSITLKKTSSTKELEIKSIVSNEQVVKGKLSIAKGSTDGSSGVVEGLKGIEFTMKLKSEVNEKGWNSAKTYSIITTDDTGRGTSIDVPYGTYMVRETKTLSDYIKSGDFFVTIDKDKEIEYRMINNGPFKTWLQLVKTDKQGHNVKLSHATFKIKDSAGNYLKQKVGLLYKDEWSTDKDGMVVLEDMVKAGTYYLEEIKSPDGFLLSNNIKFTIDSEGKTITFDDEGDPVFKMIIQDDKPTGIIVLNKSFEHSDDSLAPKKENLQAKFQLIANSEIVDPADGTIIYHKGDIVKIDNSQNGIYTTSEDGKLEISALPLGTKGASYILKEVETEKGYVLNNAVITYDFTIKDNTTKVYREIKEMENKLTTAYFKKSDVAGKEVEGAKLVLSDKDGNTIDEWISSKKDHIIKGLTIGDTYTLHEEVCAEGYVKATDITFTFKEDNQKTTMIDKIVSISKTDVTRMKEIAGAKLTITDKDNQIVDEWISSNQEHRVKGLIEGESYTLTETTAPNGFVKAESITFKVSSQKVNEHIIMKDKTVSFTKTDVTGEKELEGAQIKVTDEDGNTVDEWISTKEPHYINNLEEGKIYVLTEVIAPEGYIKAESITFEVTTDKENQTIVMKDKQVSFKKIDQNGHAVIGAKLQIVEKESQKIIETFVTDKNDYYSKNVEMGNTYILQEIETPENYIKADDIEFTVSKENENQVISMTDIKLDKVVISKQDATTKKELEGAHLKITDEDGNIIEEWISTKQSHEVMLEVGKTYILTETTAPQGYTVAESITFTVDDNGGVVQKIVMLDQSVPTVVKTGDSIHFMPYVCIGLCSIAGIYIFRKRGKSNEQ